MIMDVQRTLVAKPLWKKYWVIFPAAVLMTAIYLLKNYLN